MVDKLVELLKQKHGKDLDLKNEVYFLFVKGAMFSLYYDDGENTLKADVEFLPEDHTHVYFGDENINDLL